MRIILFSALLLLFSSDLTAQKLPENNSRNLADTDLQLGQSYLKKAAPKKLLDFPCLVPDLAHWQAWLFLKPAAIITIPTITMQNPQLLELAYP